VVYLQFNRFNKTKPMSPLKSTAHKLIDELPDDWLKDESLDDTDNLPEPSVIAAEIVENLVVALEQFREIEAEL
jgi:hypothetical protein